MKATFLPLVLLLVIASFAESVLSATPAVRIYQGLCSTDSAQAEPLGGITVSIHSSGRFTGSFRSQGQKVAFRGVLQPDLTGEAENMGVTLSFLLDPVKNELTGTLTSEFGGSSPIRAVAKASPEDMAARGFAGKYTLRFSDGFLPGQGAFGNGFATLSISASGSMRVAGRFADGVPFAFTSAVGGDGTFPFDVAMHKGKSAARGWLTVVGSSTAVPDQSDLSGQVVWHSDLTTVAKKRNFFTEFETTLTADGSRYTPPMNGDSLLDLSTPLVRLSAGDLRRPLNREVSIRGAKISTNWKTARFSLQATPGNGALSGKFLHPATRTKRPFYGVVLQKQKVAAGFFLGASVGGRMSLAEKDIRSIGFDNPESDVIAILPAQTEDEPSVVILRDENPQIPHRLVFLFPNGSLIEAVSDSSERLAELTIGAHRFVLSNYTAATVNVTYHAPDGSVTAETLPLAESAKSKTFDPAKSRTASRPASMRRFWLTDNSEEVDEERETIDETVDRRLKWFADITETHPILKFYKDIVETANDLVQKARDKIQSWKDQASELSLAVTNFVENTTGNSQDLSRIVAQQAPVLMNEFPRIDPDGVAVAGLDVTDTGIRPKRDEWDPLAKNRQIDTDFSLADSPPEESVFAEMNPASPAYVPSTPTPTPNPKPTPTPTPNPKPTPTPTPNPKPTPTPTPNPKPTPNPPGGVLKTHNGWGVRSIPGVVLTGTYISEDDDAHPFIRLDGSGTGIFEMYGAPAPEHVYKIKWWVEAKSDGTLIKTDYPAAIQYTLGVEYVDKPYQGLKFDRLNLAVQKAANGKIYIMDRSKSKN